MPATKKHPTSQRIFATFFLEIVRLRFLPLLQKAKEQLASRRGGSLVIKKKICRQTFLKTKTKQHLDSLQNPEMASQLLSDCQKQSFYLPRFFNRDLHSHRRTRVCPSVFPAGSYPLS
uniref:Uncharacterized protein n=1 Tax=Micrurus spixii TaxID=129469 RepID=A0A2D4MTP6_9SAUR